MRLDWQKDPNSLTRFIAESARYRYVMAVTSRGKVQLMVQHASDDSRAKPIDERPCISRRNAERVAQRFEDNKGTARRLR